MCAPPHVPNVKLGLLDLVHTQVMILHTSKAHALQHWPLLLWVVVTAPGWTRVYDICLCVTSNGYSAMLVYHDT